MKLATLAAAWPCVFGALFMACGDDTQQGGGNQGAENPGAGNQGGDGQGANNPGGNGNGAANVGGDGAGNVGGGGNCDCTGKECGPDGCGGVCGTCEDGESCNTQTGTCQGFCGNSCEGSCGPCPSNSSQTLTCTSGGVCKCNLTCTPNCAGKTCGDDTCGGSCGPCDVGSVCAFQGQSTWNCESFGGTDPAMSFFVTSRGTYDQGGNLGGLAGGDAICAQHAAEAGVSGRTWRAYLSTAGNPAKDRIGDGPWVNARGEAIVGACSDCVADLLSNGVAPELVLTELGTQIDWALAHDILTGSTADGNPSGADCAGWTSNNESDQVTVGHSNEQGAWTSSHTTGCDRVGMNCTAGQGHLYCFAL